VETFEAHGKWLINEKENIKHFCSIDKW